MTCATWREMLKTAGFPLGAHVAWGTSYNPPECGGEWSEHSRRHGVTIRPYDLDEHMQDIRRWLLLP